MRLHLGCATVHLDGWLNVDRRYLPGVERVDNIGILQHYPVGGVEEIYCCHALDHFDRWTYKTVLQRWFDLLAPGGTLWLAMPDFAWAVAHYQKTARVEDIIGHLYAGQDYPDNVRHFVWDFAMAQRDLAAAGFTKIERYDPDWFLGLVGASDSSTIRDAYGTLRSLCVRADKPR